MEKKREKNGKNVEIVGKGRKKRLKKNGKKKKKVETNAIRHEFVSDKHEKLVSQKSYNTPPPPPHTHRWKNQNLKTRPPGPDSKISKHPTNPSGVWAKGVRTMRHVQILAARQTNKIQRHLIFAPQKAKLSLVEIQGGRMRGG